MYLYLIIASALIVPGVLVYAYGSAAVLRRRPKDLTHLGKEPDPSGKRASSTGGIGWNQPDLEVKNVIVNLRFPSLNRKD